MRETREQCAAITQSLLCQLRFFGELNVNSSTNASTSRSSTQQLLPSCYAETPLLCRNPHPPDLLTYSWLSHWEKKKIGHSQLSLGSLTSPGAKTFSHRHKTAPFPPAAFLAVPIPKDLRSPHTQRLTLNTKTLFLPGALVKQPPRAARFPSAAD